MLHFDKLSMTSLLGKEVAGAAGVTCVVVAFHRPGAVERLLQSLGGTDTCDVVVVNVEGDEAVAGVALERGATIIDLHGNPGYAAAVNAGVQRVATPVIIFMNDDVEANSDAISRLASVVSSGEADVAVPALVTNEGIRESTIAALPSPSTLAFEWLLLPDRPLRPLSAWLRLEKWRVPRVAESIDAAAATVVAARSDLLRQFPLPEAYFLYWEESEWFWNLRDHGAVVHFRPEITVRHGGGRGDVRSEKSRLMARNAVRVVRRTQGRAAAAVAWPLVVAWNTRLVLTALLVHRRFLRARLAGLRASLAAWREVL